MNLFSFSFGVVSVFVCLIGSSGVLAQKMYKWYDENGVLQVTQQPPPADARAFNKKDIKANQRTGMIEERDEYELKRKQLLQQISYTTSSEKRERLKRELNVLDLSWYDKYDPDRAAQLRAEMGEAKIRVIKKKDGDPANEQRMKRHSAFY